MGLGCINSSWAEPSRAILSITFSTLYLFRALCKCYKIALRNTKFVNSKSCPDYIFRTSLKYKRKFTPQIYRFTFYSLSPPSLLSQISNYKNPTKIGVFLLKRTAFQPLINIKWKVSSISLCMQVNCTVFFLLHWV